MPLSSLGLNVKCEGAIIMIELSTFCMGLIFYIFCNTEAD